MDEEGLLDQDVFRRIAYLLLFLVRDERVLAL
jgi:hypothetical protein